MGRAAFRPFSKRFDEAIRSRTLRLSIPRRLRRRLWLIMCDHNPTYYYQPDPSDRWNEQTTTMAELPSKLLKLYGVEKLEAFVEDERRQVDLEGFVMGGYPSQVLDVVELFAHGPLDRSGDFHAEVNQAFHDEKCPWLLYDGCFFQLDSQFLDLHVLQRTHELLTAARFEGALQEFVEARNDLAAGDFKGAIHSAGKAFESVLKAIQNRQDGNAKALVDALKATNFYDGLPATLVAGFSDQVLMTLPALRNKLGGHGQGSDVVEVPRSVAELAVHLAGVFIVFLVKRHLELSPVQEASAETMQTGTGDAAVPF